ncbi:hypothetical protein C8A01DRAFT_36732 [Parachaetomium inaequale]|uniref:F-box domain-containing protein n=1 Tax=Parachaetomium inaequale TaxID=2588326 RepID=A0AAN6PEA6_9PEZI|nr:hypothetical protein C8A01DRAFT_36732 [Parachaetomium inaequale]
MNTSLVTRTTPRASPSPAAARTPRTSLPPPGITDLPVELLLHLQGFLTRGETNALAATCNGFSALFHPLLWRDDIATGTYDSAAWAVRGADGDSVEFLERVVEVYGADPRRWVRATGTRDLTSASLLGLAAWYGRSAQTRWLLARGADAVGIAGVVDSPLWEWRPRALDMVLLGRRSNSETGGCPAALFLALLEHGADGRVLLMWLGDMYRCDEHKNDCATPIIEWAVSMSGRSPMMAMAAINAGIDFVLDCVGRPVLALSILLDASTPPIPPWFHPVVKCVQAIIEKCNTEGWNSGLMDALEYLAPRINADPLERKAVPLAYQAITRSSINPDIRYQMLKLLLETTGVHPDVEEPCAEESALLIEVNRLVDAGSCPDLRCLEVLLRYGADPLRRYSRIEGGACSPLVLKSHIWVAKKGQLGS